MSDKRLVDIESRIAFQENIIRELNDVVCKQQDQIDELKKTCELLLDQVRASGMTSRSDAKEDKPPHY